MKIIVALILSACAYAQVQTIPNTSFPAVRALMNSNFSWLNANKAGAGTCGSGQFAVQTTSGGVVCLAVDWSVLANKPAYGKTAGTISPGNDSLQAAAVGKANGTYCVVVSGGVATLTQSGCPGSGGGGGGGLTWSALTNGNWTSLTNSQWLALSN